MFRPQNVTVSCPQCGFSYRAPVFNIVDVGATPELKSALLSGQLNASQCPNCNNVNFLATPLLYHDPENEFLAVFLPQQLNVSEQQRQKTIGDLTKALMDGLPPEQRRGYMLNPRQFLTMDSLVEKVLEFEGITPEMIEASRKKVTLVDRLVRLQDDDLAFQAAVAENKDLLDQEFFMLLTNFFSSAQSQGEEETAKAIAKLREKLLPVTETGQRILRQRAAVQSLGEKPTRAQIMQSVIEGDMDQVEAITVVARPALDYQFFQDLTARIEKADGTAKEELEAKRERMLEILESIRAAEAEELQSASQIVQALLSAEDMENAVDQMLPYIDRTVLTVLMMNIANAEEQNATAAATRLRQLYDMIVDKMSAQLPPELVLVSSLLEADYPDETRDILRENKSSLTPAFLAYLETTIKQLESENGERANKEAARHLRNVLTQARLGA